MFVFHTGLRQRNPLLRLIGSVLGLVVVLGLLALGMFAFVALLVGGVTWFLIHALLGKRPRARRATQTPVDAGVIDGEFVVVRDDERHTRLPHTVTTAAPDDTREQRSHRR